MAKKKKSNLKRNILIGIILVGIIGAIAFFGVLGSVNSSECGAFSGTGTVYYWANINGEYLNSAGNDYIDVYDVRYNSRELESIVKSVDSFNEGKQYNPTPSIEWAKCTVGSYTPHRCANPYSSCQGVPMSEIDAIRESMVANIPVSVYRLEDNSCNSISILPAEILENDYTTVEECSDKIIVVEEEEVVEEIIEVPVECNDNVGCISICGEDIPTCELGECFCSGNQVFEEELIKDKTQIYFYAIPVFIFGLIALIIWQLRKKPKRKR